MKSKYLKLALMSFMMLSMIAARGQQSTTPQLGKNSIEEVIAAMTLEEKVSIVVGGGMNVPGMQMPGMTLPEPTDAQKRVRGAAGTITAIPRLGIPGIVVCDGPSGINAFNTGRSRVYWATAWPTGTLLASSWDTTLIKKVGAAYGKEAKEYGIDVILGPGMNIHRNPLGGRNFEYYSEDPVVTGNVAAAMVNGIQSNGIGVSAKHFFANNQETNRNTVNTIISERAIREIYLKGWEIMVKKSAPWTIMSSYNYVNGIYTSENSELLSTILRNEWGYKGMVMTDWFGGRNAVEQERAGNDLLMPGMPPQSKAIIDAVKGGTLDEKLLDRNIANILSLILKSPTFNGYKYSDNPDLKTNAKIAREAAAEGMVLLKNQSNALPLSTGTGVALFGNNAIDIIAGGTGSGGVNKMYSVSLAEGLFHAGMVLNPDLYITYSNYMDEERAKRPKKGMMEEFMNPTKPIGELSISDAAISKAANESQVAMISIGRDAGEGTDRKVNENYYLSDTEKSLVKRVSTSFHGKNKKVIVVLNIAAVTDVAQWQNDVDAILLAYQPGLEGGNAMADVISGKVNPSGKLATTFPASYESDPTAKNFPGKEFPDRKTTGLFGEPLLESEVVYEEGVYVGYRYYNTFSITPSYEFGHGLSYTDFTYGDLKLSSSTFTDKVVASVTVTNTGKVAGKEVVQLYLSAPTKKLDKPAAELKAFAKTNLLKPGESQTFEFKLSTGDLASYQTKTSSWVADAGVYTVKIGTSQKVFTSGTFKVSKDIIVGKTNKVLVPKVVINELKSLAKK
jgi:beta-glucosidase